MGSSEQFKKILEFRERKSQELKRPVSFSEAIALWFSENLKFKTKHPPKKVMNI